MKEGDVDKIKEFIDMGAEMNTRGESGDTLLASFSLISLSLSLSV